MKILVVLAILAMMAAPPAAMILSETYENIYEEEKALAETKDEVPPTSTMTAQPRVLLHPTNCLCLPEVLLVWSGKDDREGTGVMSYDVQFQRQYINLDPDTYRTCVMPFWQDLQTNTTNTSVIFHPALNDVYLFRVRARDYAGNVEPWPALYDTFIVTVRIDEPEEVVDRIKDEVTDRIWDWIWSTFPQIDENIDRELPGFLEDIYTNQAPTADAGDDCYACINRSPQIYADNIQMVKDAITVDEFPEIEFNGSASYDTDGEIISYIWDFGDGSYGYDAQTSHKYFTPGEYTVMLTVIDNYGKVSEDELICTIDVVC